MKVNKLLISFAAMIVCGVALAACQKEEQGRTLRFEKGTYAGAPDTALSEATRKKLRARVYRMR